jgi:hypothetical protein
MKKTIDYYVWPSDMRFEERLRVLDDFATGRGLQWRDDRGYFTFRLEVDRYESVSCDTLEELLAYMKQPKGYQKFTAAKTYVGDDKEIDMAVRLFGYLVQVEVSSRDIDMVESAHSIIRRELQLSNPAPSLGEGPQEEWLNATVFIGRHFDSKGDECYESLAAFLELLGFEVEQGKGYRSQTIPAKVRDRIDNNDIFIAAVTADGPQDWVTAEASYALGKGKHVIIAVEGGVEYEPAILGKDLEQIRFPAGHIEKTFIPLLEEFTSVRVKGIL